METFFDHMIFVFLTGAICIAVLGGFCWLTEKIVNKYGRNSESVNKFVDWMFKGTSSPTPLDDYDED